MSYDENSFKHHKQTSSSEVRRTTVSFMHQSSILVAWINDGRPSFLLWLRPRLLSLSLEKEIEGAAGAILRWISFELWNSLSQTARWAVVESFLFQIPFNGALYEFKGFQSVSISVSFCDLGVELYTQDLVKFLRCRLFQDIFFKMAGSGLAPASEDVCLFTVLLSRSKDYVCLFTVTELRSCIASFETTGNLETCIFLRWLWICCFVSFVYCTRYPIPILSRCGRKNVRQNGHWVLETSCKVGLQPEGAHYHLETVII